MSVDLDLEHRAGFKVSINCVHPGNIMQMIFGLAKCDSICSVTNTLIFQFRHNSDNQVNNRQSEVLIDSR
jgi:hypothetical protein